MSIEKMPYAPREEILAEVELALREGLDEQRIVMKIISAVPKSHLDAKNAILSEILSVSKARIKNKKVGKGKGIPDNFIFTEQDLRFATHRQIAEWRAKKLKCHTIVDCGCGIGVQSIAFSKTCERVIAIDIDKRKIEYAKENARIANANNIRFVIGDATAEIKKVKKADVIFCDPERLAEESERSVDRTSPKVTELISAGRKITDNIAVELPPQIRQVPFDSELEYVSIDGQLNRLTAYLGALKKAERSAVIIAEMPEITGGAEKKIAKIAVVSGKPKELAASAFKKGNPNASDNTSNAKYICEADPALAKAGLAYLKSESARACQAEGYENSETSKNLLYFSDKKLEEPFFKNYSIRCSCEKTEQALIMALADCTAGTTVLRIRISPEKYWDFKKRIEHNLEQNSEQNLKEKDKKANGKAYVFEIGEKYYICNKLLQ